MTDFVEYWAASRLLIGGDNPYSPSKLLDLQKTVGWQFPIPLIMWNPPWTFAFTLPFAVFDFSSSQFLWLLLNSFLVLFSAQQLWRSYGEPTASYWRPWLAALTFMPTLFVLLSGQIAPLVLFGLSAFIYFERKQQWVGLGVVTVLLFIKPHLLYLFWVPFLLWIWNKRQWGVLAGATISGLAAGIIPVLFNSAIYANYVRLYRASEIPTPFDWAAPTLGQALKVFFREGGGGLQFLPSVVGLIWVVFYWQRHKSSWTWTEQLPLILLVSVTTTAFAWTFDQVVLLPAVMHGLARLGHGRSAWVTSPAVVIYIATNIVYLTMKFFVVNDFWYLWMAPVLLGTYLLLWKQTANRVGAEGVCD